MGTVDLRLLVNFYRVNVGRMVLNPKDGTVFGKGFFHHQLQGAILSMVDLTFRVKITSQKMKLLVLLMEAKVRKHSLH